MSELDVDALVADPATGIIVCCGAGGVGKTTVAAALAVRAAESGRSVCVLTIDPALRLAQSLGLPELDNEPRAVTSISTAAGGSLDAMMLDMKRTFDEVVETHASPQKAQAIFENPFYQALSSSFAGTQEYMAMERLGQLHQENRWDLIVVDTPPSRNALDFLDAPERLSSLLDGRLVRLLLAPAKGPARLLTAGLGIVTSALTRILGAQVLKDLQTFVAAFDTLFGGFRQRAEATYALLKDDSTAFVVVATPEHPALREARFFIERLREDEMPLSGLVINRVHADVEGGISAAEAAAASARLADDRSVTERGTAQLLDVHADHLRLAAREARVIRRFVTSHRHVPVGTVEALAGDVHDVAALRQIGDQLTR